MFGSDKHDDENDENTSVISPGDDSNSSNDSTPSFSAPDVSLPSQSGNSDSNDPDSNDAPADTSSDDSPVDSSVPPVDDNPPADSSDSVTPTPVEEPASAPSAPETVISDDGLLTTTDKDDLIRIKQEALQQLTPLVDHLDQSPEEKFRTTMMMIQASDDEALLQTAYEAAKSIEDDKVRAQALLDVINEINYFTQQNKDE